MNNIDLFFLTETWLTNKVNDATVCPFNYNIYRSDRSSRGGGVAILFKNSLKVIKVKNDSISTSNINFEYLCVDVIFKKMKLRFCCVYLPPLSARCALTVQNVIKMIKMVFPKECSFYVLGDFNMPNIDWRIPSTDFNKPHECFLNFCTDNFLTQVIENPTHKNGNILDLIICNHFGLDRIISHSTNFPLTNTCDHNLLSLKIKIENKIVPIAKEVSYDYKKADFESINDFLSKINWTSLFKNSENLQHFYDQFISSIQISIKRFVPIFSKNNKSKKYPSHIKKLLKEKANLYKKSKTNKSLLIKYKNKSKEYQLAVKKYNFEYENKFCKNPNLKKFYSYVKSKLKLNNSIHLLYDNDKNKTVTSDFEIATLFNINFQKVFKKDESYQSFKLPQKNCSKMQNFFITYEDIISSINHLKDKIIRTPENIPPYYIKHVIQSIIFPLSLIFNCSLELSDVPKQWKTSFIIPVHKKGNIHDALNYRPISLTSGFSRIYEHIVSVKILNHLFDNKLLTNKQFGFVPNRSSTIQLLTCLHSWLVPYLKNEFTKVVYTDIQKAFDSVSHKRLLKILNQYGLHESLIDWFDNFLNNRSQRVLINNTLSDSLTIYSGVPQGGVVGPLLFLIYINDICSNIDIKSELSLFADDAKIFSQSNTSLQLSLDNIYIWLKTRKLNLNPSKCKILTINKKESSPTDLLINNIKLPEIKVFKDLGIYISKDLKWNEHINYLYKIAKTTCYQILKSFKTNSASILTKLFKTYVRPKLEFSTQIWSPHLKKDINKIESVQRSFTRHICSRCNISYTSYNDRMIKFGLKSLEYRRWEFDLLILYKIINGKYKSFFDQFFNFSQNKYQLRGNNLKIKCKHDFQNSQWQGAFFHRAKAMWNRLPQDIVSCERVEQFRLKLKRFDLNTINTSKIN